MNPQPFLEWLFATLSGDATLSALVTNRIYPDAAPAGTVNPCLVYQFLGDVYDEQLDAGPIESGSFPVQIRAYGATRAAANAVRETVRQLFQNRAPETIADGVRLAGAEYSDAAYTFERDTEDYGSLAVVTFHLEPAESGE